MTFSTLHMKNYIHYLLLTLKVLERSIEQLKLLVCHSLKKKKKFLWQHRLSSISNALVLRNILGSFAEGPHYICSSQDNS